MVGNEGLDEAPLHTTGPANAKITNDSLEQSGGHVKIGQFAAGAAVSDRSSCGFPLIGNLDLFVADRIFVRVCGSTRELIEEILRDSDNEVAVLVCNAASSQASVVPSGLTRIRVCGSCSKNCFDGGNARRKTKT